ncbi:ABC transporter ATP-binding protein [Paracoccus subflavus]|uniref:ABC transporter ATP-binding protein n=1 Tax=Paracoccus subflavus TaxID=2528244 RepID=A0A4Q9FWQ7_9RHOB|nr:ABC transporter ATP-binding protein [Paracoccus subflavus]TBN37738.1 ABC transporter ATP-binding protein [Paracoccus subflavus]
MTAIIQIENLSKQYGSGTKALSDVSLDIQEGEIIALLGPNGAGKTTLISVICGLVVPTGGTVRVGGHDIRTDWRAARKLIGLVPQEIALEPFEKVMNCVRFTRGLYGEGPDDAYIEQVLRSLALWDKRDAATRELSGGMKRRVLIAKALAHRPKVLFLDEPTAGVDVALRREMWEVVDRLRREGVTIILTTHYLEEAEEMADRIGVINHGRLLLVRPTSELMGEFGRKTLTIEVTQPLAAIPDDLAGRGLHLSPDGRSLTYDYDTRADRTGIARLLGDLAGQGIMVRDVSTRQSSLEEVFMTLVSEPRQEVTA